MVDPFTRLGGVAFGVLFQSLMLATMTSLAGPSPALGSSSIAPMWAAYLLAVQAPWLKLTPPCTSGRGKSLAPCLSAVLAAPFGAGPELMRRRRHGSILPRATLGGTLGGFRAFDVMGADHVSAGPQVSWLTPDSPREDLLRLRVVSPGWAVRYTWEEAHVSVGVAAFTRFLTFGEDWPVVDMLTSEARVEIQLP